MEVAKQFTLVAQGTGVLARVIFFSISHVYFPRQNEGILRDHGVA